MYYPWKINFGSNTLLVGPSACGKSTFLMKLLETPEVWERPPDKIVYCYGIFSKTVKYLSENRPDIILHEGLPPQNLTEMFSPNQSSVLCVDDLSLETQNSPSFTAFLVRGSHHLNVALISIEHFLYTGNSSSRERRSQQDHWSQVIVFRHKRSFHNFATLSRQMAIADPKLIQRA